MTWRLASLLAILTLAAVAPVTAADSEAMFANKREYIITDLEQRASELLVKRVTLRQQVLDSGPELSRKVCDRIRVQMDGAGLFKFAKMQFKQLQDKDHAGKLTPVQLERVGKLKTRIKMLQEEEPLNCKALAPINP